MPGLLDALEVVANPWPVCIFSKGLGFRGLPFRVTNLGSKGSGRRGLGGMRYIGSATRMHCFIPS